MRAADGRAGPSPFVRSPDQTSQTGRLENPATSRRDCAAHESTWSGAIPDFPIGSALWIPKIQGDGLDAARSGHE